MVDRGTPSAEDAGQRLRVVPETGPFAGQAFGGWTRATVSRALDRASAGFSLATGGSTTIPLRPNDAVRLFYDEDVVVQGFVDELEGTVAGGSREISVRGRDLIGDLVDSSVDVVPGEFLGQTLAALTARILEPFSRTFRFLALEDPVIPSFKVQNGETAFAAIERLVRARGLLVYPDIDGTLLIAPPAELAPTQSIYQLEDQSNVSRIKVRIQSQERFSEYRVQSQRSGDQLDWGDTVAHIEGVALDKGIKRHRPKIFVAEQQLDLAQAQERASWEMAYRAAKGLTVLATVQGWRQSDGRLWAVNERVEVHSDLLGIESVMLINSVRFKFDPASAGTVTELGLVRPDAYIPKPERDDDTEEQTGGWLATATEDDQ